MPREFTRPPDGFEFTFGGVKANERPDSLPPTKYPIAVNIRSYAQNQIRTRPGLVKLFDGGQAANAPDLRAYAALQTDNLPRILLRASDDTIWLDNGVQVGTLVGGGVSLGASLIPFRPNQSPQPWMYIANGSDYQKFSSPSATNSVIKQKVGIAEPQASPDAGIGQYTVGLFNTGATTFTPAGTAGAVTSGNRINETVTNHLGDPTLGYTSYQVASASNYQRGMAAIFHFSGGGSVESTILDVFAPCATAIGISGIFYFAGTTGHCVIVSSFVGGGPGIGDESLSGEATLSSLRRGALIQIGSEVCYVLSVTIGPDKSCAIETTTVGAFTTANTFTILPAVLTIVAGATTITDADYSSSVTTGLGTLTATPGNNPFVNANLPLRSEDYITIGINVSNLANLVEVKFLIDVGDGSFTQNFYYFTLRPADITAAVLNAATQLAAVQTTAQNAIVDELNAIATDDQTSQTWAGDQTPAGASQWAQLTFPVSSLTRVGSDLTKSLQTMSKFQILVNCSGSVTVIVDAPIVVGGFSPDVGDVGSPYYYRIRPRSSVTGVKGNPSPATRYGVNPRRQAVLMILPTSYSDPQADTWDIFRYGGSITSWRFIGESPIGPSFGRFYDVYGDDAAAAGDELEFDNFEPWPSVDFPNTGTLVSLVGTTAVVSTTDPDILMYLPGTLVEVGGQNAYTLRQRPTLISGNNYLLQFIENAGTIGGPPYFGSTANYIIQEPLIANQHLPYMWGPDVNGTIFACGDGFRPGNLYFSKNSAPDAAPDTYNIEITQPSEPLLGGEIVDGLSFVASSKRWWALYPQPDNPAQRYNFVEQPFTRGLAAPFGHCTDGKRVFYWAKDGIYANDESLTDADLYTIFPHEGVPGQTVTYNGISILPPDYAQAPKFRLSYANGYLYATYPSIGGGGLYAAVLVCNLRTKAWSTDSYAARISNVYQIEQTVESQGVRNPVVLIVGQPPGGTIARVYTQTDLVNDDGTPIGCQLATFEWDGGDKRAPKQWGDIFLDCLPAGGSFLLQVTPMSLGAPVAAAQSVPQSANRQRVPLSVGGIVVSDFMGLFLQWVDDFTRQTQATQLYLWQPSFVVQPARDLSWTSFGSAFGLKGFLHLRQIELAWVSTQPITLSTVTFDGLDPAPIVVPSSGGAYQKVVFPFSANKGLLFSFTATSTAPFQIFNDDSELYVGEWGRQDGYQVFRGFGGRTVDDAPI